MTRRTWFVWHSWIGLTAGLLLFVICWSGTIAVFSREIDGLLDPVAPARSWSGPVAWQAIHDNVRARHPGWLIDQIVAPPAPGHAAEAWAIDEEDVTRRLYADPATGALIAERSFLNVQRFFRSFHMSLFVNAFPVAGIPLGYLLVGLLSLPLLGSLATSLVFYRRFWRGFLKLERRKGARSFWSDAHKLTGVWSLWFLLLIGVTGIWYLVEWKAPEATGAPPAAAALTGPPLPLEPLLAAARRAYPEFRVTTLGLYSYDKGLLDLLGQDGSWLVRDQSARAWVDSRSGKVLAVRRPRDLTGYERWIDTADPLHFGNFGGLWIKAIWFVFGLGLSGLCLSGAFLQARRQALQRGRGALRRPVAIAYGLTIVTLLAACLFGYRELLGYGPAGAFPAVPAPTAAFIALWILSTVAILTVWMRVLR